ncbi:HNH endonuclease [Glaciecola sp. 1036]|uniref:HNH endonuclease n=1 Tax=Alteromonadaceae TaxID=72275 RepID=UPI003CFD55BD
MSLAQYAEKFQSLKPDKSSGHAKPHKVCMMFAVMDLIELGHIQNNHIYYDDLLKQRFSWHFSRLKQKNDAENPFLPFYHLQSSGWWHLDVAPENQQAFKSIKSATDSNIKKLVNFAYLDETLFELLLVPESAAVLRNCLTSNLDSMEEQYGRWAKSIGKSDKTIQNYLGALKNSIPKWMDEVGVSDKGLLGISSFTEYQKIVSKTYEVKEFKEYNARGKGMYSAAINSYKDFLLDITQADIKQDIDEIILDKNIPDTQKAVMVNARVGQGQFRENLIGYWKGCAVTQYPNYRFLIASHIKPWSKSNNEERLDPYNGLLLLANIDKAFDLGFISFSEKGKIMISEHLEERQTLGIHPEMNILVSKKHQDYLAFHREMQFRL